ncbi:hypothetical protein IQ249_16645 [Lusitaniella coriacea LEGE 07157]|uniref:Tic22 family protein n=1 Tax=Lusitaniella coriacea LEGE 07157 TaxID=945747 RepID=A0A8J7J4F4_9CYAN|nr:Tic22 family protein [Lusitaniella coriacea]MBE9117529.1 hypothetical protein [Lusitaniella coriacea LEGE 07157]
MKSLFHWGTTLSLTGSLAWGMLLGGSVPALALPPEQVSSSLGVTPIFFIMSGNNQLMYVSTENQERVSPRFISRQDAEAFLAKLKQDNPQLANQAQVAAIPLGELYKADLEGANQSQGVEFQYVATQQQIRAAQQVQQQFVGTPLFYATVGDDSLTIQQNGKTVIPFFFEQQGLMQMVERFRREQPAQAANVQVKVVPLEAVIETLKTSNDQALTQIVLVPSQEALEFVRSVQEQVQQQNQSNRSN